MRLAAQAFALAAQNLRDQSFVDVVLPRPFRLTHPRSGERAISRLVEGQQSFASHLVIIRNQMQTCYCKFTVDVNGYGSKIKQLFTREA